MCPYGRKGLHMRVFHWSFRHLLPLCLLCGLLAACAGRQATDAVPEQDGLGGDASARGPFAPLPSVPVRPGQRVHVAVSGGEPDLNADLQSMLTAYIQSERGLTPAESARDAHILVRVRIEDIYPLGSRSAPVSAGKALSGAAAGAMLGMLLGGAVDVNGRSGAGWGAGGGALLGLGAALLDSRGKSKVWGLRAGVGIRADGREPAENEMRPVAVSAEGEDMGREDCLPALEDSLSLEVLKALAPWGQT